MPEHFSVFGRGKAWRRFGAPDVLARTCFWRRPVPAIRHLGGGLAVGRAANPARGGVGIRAAMSRSRLNNRRRGSRPVWLATCSHHQGSRPSNKPLRPYRPVRKDKRMRRRPNKPGDKPESPERRRRKSVIHRRSRRPWTSHTPPPASPKPASTCARRTSTRMLPDDRHAGKPRAPHS
jgi:hypothetical protein